MKKHRIHYALQLAAAVPSLVTSLILFSLFPVLVVERLSVQNWQPTPATLTFIALDQDYDGDGSCRVRLTYRYEVAGREFEERDEGHHGSINPTTSDCETIYETLTPMLHQPNALTCYVNPSAPSQSTVIRDVDWPWIIGLTASVIFSFGLGIALAISGGRGIIRSVRRDIDILD